MSDDDLANVASALDATLSADSAVRKPAESWLTAAEDSSATHLIQILIQALHTSKGFPPQTRHLASLLLKNVIKRRWRDGVDPSQKAAVREAAVGLVAEEQDAHHSGAALAGAVGLRAVDQKNVVQ